MPHNDINWLNGTIKRIKRTEQEILKDFEALGYEIPINNNESVEFHKFGSIGGMIVISVFKPLKEYSKYLIMKNVMTIWEININQ